MQQATLAQASGRIRAGVGQTVAACASRGRKVRASQGRVPGNAWGARAYDQCSREQTADGRFADQVRVKGCGKSAPRGWQQFVAR